MTRLLPGFAVVAAMLAFLPGPIALAASNEGTTLFPLDGPNQLETHMHSIASSPTATVTSPRGPTCAHPTV